MERAGHTVFLNWKSFNAQQTLILVGSGNNAGDGYEVARLIKKADRHVVVLDDFIETIAIHAHSKNIPLMLDISTLNTLLSLVTPDASNKF